MKHKIIMVMLSVALIVSLALAGCVEPVTPSEEPVEGPPSAEWIPKRPIMLIVPYSAGGGSDTRARILSVYWPKYLAGDQSVVVINKPGGGGTLGTTEGYLAKPDGYTLVMPDTVPMVLNQLSSKVEYDVLKFEAIGTVNIYTSVAETNPKTIPEIKTWDQLLERIYDLRIATVGYGSRSHIAPLAIGKITGLYDPAKLHFVHYDGSAPAIAGFLRGDVDMMIGPVESHLPYAKEGTMNFLMVFADEPHRMCPNVPTDVQLEMANARSVNRFIYASGGLFAPPGTPKNVVEILAKTLEQTMKDPEVMAAVEKANRDMYWESREKLAQAIKDLYEMWSEQTDILEILKG